MTGCEGFAYGVTGYPSPILIDPDPLVGQSIELAYAGNLMKIHFARETQDGACPDTACTAKITVTILSASDPSWYITHDRISPAPPVSNPPLFFPQKPAVEVGGTNLACGSGQMHKFTVFSSGATQIRQFWIWLGCAPCEVVGT